MADITDRWLQKATLSRKSEVKEEGGTLVETFVFNGDGVKEVKEVKQGKEVKEAKKEVKQGKEVKGVEEVKQKSDVKQAKEVKKEVREVKKEVREVKQAKEESSDVMTFVLDRSEVKKTQKQKVREESGDVMTFVLDRSEANVMPKVVKKKSKTIDIKAFKQSTIPPLKEELYRDNPHGHSEEHPRDCPRYVVVDRDGTVTPLIIT